MASCTEAGVATTLWSCPSQQPNSEAAIVPSLTLEIALCLVMSMGFVAELADFHAVQVASITLESSMAGSERPFAISSFPAF